MENDGGPAFPQNDAVVNRINNLDGMSLRDYFAAQIVGGMMSSYSNDDSVNSLVRAAMAGARTIQDQIAFEAYRISEALLKERERANSPG